MVYVIYAFGMMMIVCELGQGINSTFDECIDIIDQFEWYSFPIDIQRMLPLFLNFAKEPIEIKCFGTVTCDRETFKCVRASNFGWHVSLLHKIVLFGNISSMNYA